MMVLVLRSNAEWGGTQNVTRLNGLHFCHWQVFCEENCAVQHSPKAQHLATTVDDSRSAIHPHVLDTPRRYSRPPSSRNSEKASYLAQRAGGVRKDFLIPPCEAQRPWGAAAPEADVGAAGRSLRSQQRLQGASQQQIRDAVCRVLCSACAAPQFV